MAVYLYGVVGAGRELPPGLRGIGDEPVRGISCGDVVVAVSDLADECLELDMEGIAAHAAVVDALFAGGPVLPFAVGTAGEEPTLRAELEARAPVYAERLRRLRGHCELEVRAWLEEESALSAVLARSAEARTLSRTVGPGSSLEDQVRLGELLSSELEVQKQLTAAELDEQLAPLAVEISLMPPGETEAFRAAYLVPAAGADDFARQAGSAQKEMPGVHVEVAGPVPPYSFAEPPPGR